MDECYLQFEKKVLLCKKNLCRLCLASKDVVRTNYIPVEILAQTDIPQLFEDITNSKLCMTEIYPEYICFKCERDLLKFYSMREKFRQVDAFWKIFLLKHINYAADNVEESIVEVPIEPIEECHMESNDYEDPLIYSEVENADSLIEKSHINQIDDKKSAPEPEIPLDDNDGDNVGDDDDDFNNDNTFNHDTNESEPLNPQQSEITSNSKEMDENLTKSEKRQCEADSQQDSNKNNELSVPKEKKYNSSLYSCDLCERKFFKRKQLIAHMDIHSTDCHICNKQYDTHQLRRIHIRMSHSIDGTQITCVLCNKIFKNRSSRKTHMRQCHNNGSNSVCHICGKIFNNNLYLNAHIRNQHFRTEMQYKCSYCERKFRSKHNKKLHERVHTNDRPYICDICGFAFTQVSLMRRHRLLHLKLNKAKRRNLAENNADTIKCDICFKKFFKLANLRVHLNKIHKEMGMDIWEKKLETNCLKCGQGFADPKELAEHKKTHLEFECEICKNRFCTVESLNHHKELHLKKDRPFKCELCGASYNRKPHLSQHITAMHTDIRPHVCSHCQKGFPQSYQLKSHISQVHKGEQRPYKCDLCEKCCSTASNLSKHKQYIHQRNYRYVCSLCEKGFLSGASLQKHSEICNRNHGRESERTNLFDIIDDPSVVTISTPLQASCEIPDKATMGSSFEEFV